MEAARGSSSHPKNLINNVNSSTLEALTNLGKPLQQTRVEAALNLLKQISGKEYVPKDGSELEKNEVDYVLERLVRGVGASKNTSRIGFFAALVSMLTTFPDICVKDILELIKKDLSKGKNVSKSEAADIHMGQVLVYGALIRSGRFNDATEDDQMEILDGLITAGKKRSYLTLVAYTFIIQLMEVIKKKEFKKLVWPKIEPCTGLNKTWKERSLDDIYMLLAVKSRFPSVIPDSQSPTDPANIPQCALLLVNVPNINYISHPVYEVYCKQLISTEFISLFWSEIEKLLSKPNRNRQLISLEILGHIVNQLPDKNMIPNFITPLFISLSMKSRSSKKNPQEKDLLNVFVKVKQIFQVMMKNLENETTKEKTKVEVLKRLLFHPGNFMFEKNTGLKVVQPVTTSLTPTGVKKLAKVYREVVSGQVGLKESNEDNNKKKQGFGVLPWKNKERIYAAQLLARLVATPVMSNEQEWKFEQCKCLLHWGFYSKHFYHSDAAEIGFVGVELSHALRESFFRSLDHKSGGLDGLIDLLLRLVRHVDELLKDESIEDKVLKGKSVEDWDKAVLVINKLEKQIQEKEKNTKLEGKVKEVKFFLMLFLQLILQLFDWDAGLAADSLDELTTCYTKLEEDKSQNKHVGGTPKSAKKNKHKSKMGEEENLDTKENEDPAWVEVVVDLFLLLLSQNRHLLRTMICSVFPYICPHITPTALHSILKVLDPASSKDTLKDNIESEEDESEDENENSDEESKSEETSDKEEEAEEMSDDELGAEEEPTVNETLRLAVQKALGSAAPTSDTDSVDLDEIGEEEGKQLDEALSYAFRLMKKTKDGGKGKKQQTKDERILTHFRLRAVDLLEIYIESQPSMALCCDLILPLLETLEFCIKDVHQKPLENRLRSCFRKLSIIKNFSSVEGMNVDILTDLLKGIIDKGSRTAPVYIDMGSEITNCCTYIIRASEYLRKENENLSIKKSKKSVKKDGKESSAIIEIYKKSLESFFTKRDSLLPVGIFRHALQIPWSGSWCLVSTLVKFAFDEEVRPFRRSQALQLLATFFLNRDLVSTQNEVHLEELATLKKEINSKSIAYLEAMKNSKDNCNIKKKNLLGLLELLKAIRSSESCGNKIKNEADGNEEEPTKLVTPCSALDWIMVGALLSDIYRGEMKVVGHECKKAIGKILKLLGLGDVILRHVKEKSQKAQEKALKVKAEKTEDDTVKEESDKSSESEGNSDTEVKPIKSEKDKELEKREKKKHRKKASKIESRKLKKEAKNFRMQEFSKGLEDSCFVGLEEVPEDVNDDESNNQTKTGKSKKRKSDILPKSVKKIKIESE